MSFRNQGLLSQERCATCKFFKKYRGVEKGTCENDDVFQYADSKSDLDNIDNESLIIMGNAVAVVGTNYFCGRYVSRKEKNSLSVANEFQHSGGYTPSAEKKHSKRRRGGRPHPSDVPETINF
jgi:hypothetical protein